MNISSILSRFSSSSSSSKEPTTTPTANSTLTNNVSNTSNTLNEANNSNQQNKSLKLNDFAELFSPESKQPSSTSSEPASSFYPDFLSKEFRDTFNNNVNFESLFPDSVFAALQSNNYTDFRNALNNAFRTAMLYTFAGLGKLTEEGFNKRWAELDSRVEALLNKNKITSTLSSHPVLSNPAVEPLRVALTESFGKKFPQATSEQIQAFVNEYLLALADAINPPKHNKAPGQEQQDWSKFL